MSIVKIRCEDICKSFSAQSLANYNNSILAVYDNKSSHVSPRNNTSPNNTET